MTKTCYVCKESKDLTDFWRSSKSKDGYKYDCKQCARAAAADWEARNRERRSVYNRSRKIGRYGITVELYDAILEAQGHACAFCGGVCPSGRLLAVDHDHETGQIRGLLCAGCNVSKVGSNTLADIPRLVDYLTDPPARAVLDT